MGTDSEEVEVGEKKLCVGPCNKEKDISEFYVQRRNRIEKPMEHCKTCWNAKRYVKTQDHEKKKEYDRIYNSQREKRDSEEDRAKNRVYAKTYRDKNLELIREKERIKYATDIQFNMNRRLRARLQALMKGVKRENIVQYLQCDFEQLCQYFEQQFDDKMSWENKGSYWDIDHVVPMASFDLKKEEEIARCFHWSNLRPLYKLENQKKCNKIDEEVIKTHDIFTLEYAKSNSLIHPKLV